MHYLKNLKKQKGDTMLAVLKIIIGVINFVLFLIFSLSLRKQKEDLIQSTKVVSIWCLINGLLLLMWWRKGRNMELFIIILLIVSSIALAGIQIVTTKISAKSQRMHTVAVYKLYKELERFNDESDAMFKDYSQEMVN